MAIATQRESVRRAERVANATERAVHQWWRDLVAILRAGPQLGVGRLYGMALAHARQLPDLTHAALADGLTDLWSWGARRAAAGIPRAVLRRAARVQVGSLGSTTGQRLGTLVLLQRHVNRVSPQLAELVSHRVQHSSEGLLSRRASRIPHVAQLTEDRSEPDPIDFLFGRGLNLDSLPDDLLRHLVLPTPPAAVIQSRVRQLIAPFLASPRPDLVDPQRFAGKLVQSYSQGKTYQEIAKDMLPIADGARASARRVARTWGIDVANRSQWEAHESLGPDLVIGYRVHATPGPNSRPWHQARDNQVYYRDPKPGQKGFAQLPHPPREPADPAERPPGSPWLAWNCL